MLTFLEIGIWYKGIRYRGEKSGNQYQVPITQNLVASYTASNPQMHINKARSRTIIAH
jgi:hypothetical protein